MGRRTSLGDGNLGTVCLSRGMGTWGRYAPSRVPGDGNLGTVCPLCSYGGAVSIVQNGLVDWTAWIFEQVAHSFALCAVVSLVAQFRSLRSFARYAVQFRSLCVVSLR